MILIVTHKEDFTADFVINKLNEKEISYYRFNCEDVINTKYSITNKDNFGIEINGFQEFESVWFRRTKLPEINVADQGQKLYLAADYEALFDNIFNLIRSPKWLSHPNDIYLAENKAFQLRRAELIGFKIPPTIVTNCQNALNVFIADQRENVIIKPIRQGRILQSDGVRTIFTNVISRNVIQNLFQFDLTPCIIQANVSKKYEIRVTVVSGRVFAAKISSQVHEETKTDWRRKKGLFTEYKLPYEVEEKCLKLTKDLKLHFGCIDLIKDTDGNYIFLEINPNGQWAWIEMEVGSKISGEIINFLTTSE